MPAGPDLRAGAGAAGLRQAGRDGDHADRSPGGRRPATRRLGTLFINPGGPGGSGIEYVDLLQQRAGWRATTSSAGTRAGSVRRPRWTASAKTISIATTRWTPHPTTAPSWRPGSRPYARSAGPAWSGPGRCSSTSRRWRRSVILICCAGWSATTRSTTSGRRTGPGSGRCTPSSSGDRVGRMVLDGSVNISEDGTITQIEGFERALDHFARWCAEQTLPAGRHEGRGAKTGSRTSLINWTSSRCRWTAGR